jgi:dolichyl-diphosphooligosaccharide--protein glycosyltransferase
MDLHILILFVPAGIISCYTRRSDGALFLILYGVTAAYFSGVMVRMRGINEESEILQGRR